MVRMWLANANLDVRGEAGQAGGRQRRRGSIDEGDLLISKPVHGPPGNLIY